MPSNFNACTMKNVSLRRQLKAKYKFDNIISDNEKMLAVFTQVEKVADTDSTILIYGRAVRARNSSRGRSTTTAIARTNRSSRLTVAPFLRICSKANSLGMRRGPLRAPLPSV